MQVFGAILVVAAYLLLSISSLVIYSLIGEGISLVLAMWIQNLVIVCIFLLRNLFTKKLEMPKRPKIIFFRSLTGVLYSLSYYSALKYASFAEVGVLTNSFPLFIVLIAWFFLGEKVLLSQWIALGFGMLGVWTILFSNVTSFWSVGIFFAAAASILWAATMIIMQKVSEYEDVYTYLFTFFAFNLVLLFPFIVTTFQMPTFKQFFFCAIVAMIALLAQYLLFIAYRICSATELAPYHFSFAFFHFLVAKGLFAFAPSLNFYIGAALIFFGGVINLILFERKAVVVKENPPLEISLPEPSEPVE